MFGLVPHNWKALTFTALAFLCALSHGEPGNTGGYPGRENGFGPDPMYDYSAEIQKNKNRSAQQAGESDADYRIRTSHLDTNYTTPPVANADVTMGTGTVDRAEKLKDARRFALEGESAAAAQAADMTVAGVTASLSILDFGGDMSKMAAATADANKYNEAAQKYAQIKLDMEAARVHNGNGAARLRFDPDDDGAGKAAAPDPKQVESILDKMSDADKQKLQDRGVDPEDLVERLLSGELDTSDPNALLKALNDPRQLSTGELAEVRALADARISEAGADIEGAAGAGSDLAASELKDSRALAAATEKAAKEEEASKTTNPGLAGIAISFINREVMGYRLGDLLGVKGRPNAKPAGVAGVGGVNGKGVADAKGKAGLRKHLTPSDYYQLQGRGITAPRHGNNIFKMARRQYRDFSKWRDQPSQGRVAFAR